MTSYTENGAVAHATTYNSLMDIFIKTVRNCSKDFIDATNPKAWDESPEMFLKLIYLTRCPRTGKGERDVSFYMLAWLKNFAPKTYMLNAETIAVEHGRIEDLLDMALFEVSGFDRDFELRLFAKLLHTDLAKTKLTGKKSFTLAVKWAPREGKYYDYVDLTTGKAPEKGKKAQRPAKMTSRLAKIMFPDDKKALQRYRKEVLGVLSGHVSILETLMCEGRWEEIDFSAVSAQAMRIFGRESITKKVDGKNEKVPGAFKRHMLEKFEDYLKCVKEGKAAIKTTGIQPHQLTRDAMRQNDETINLQWEALVDKLRGIDALGNSISVVDVSGSMHGEPMEVAVALGLIIASLAKGPFKDQMITFSETPAWHNIVGTNLHEKVTNMVRSKWGYSTNIEAVFNLILDLAIQNKVPEENMPKTLFIFTDMQFDAVHGSKYDLVDEKTLFQNIRDKWTKAGRVMPKLVFWNLRESSVKAFPVTMGEYGTAYLSGFSAELLKVFMEGCEFTPKSILDKLLSKYEVVMDNDEIKMSFAELKVLADARAGVVKPVQQQDEIVDPAIAPAVAWFQAQGNVPVDTKTTRKDPSSGAPDTYASILRMSAQSVQADDDYDMVQ